MILSLLLFYAYMVCGNYVKCRENALILPETGFIHLLYLCLHPFSSKQPNFIHLYD